MGTFNINITAAGGHGCDRKTKAGEKLYGRCGKFSCPDCLTYDFVSRMKQSGFFSGLSNPEATFTHWPDTPQKVVDDMLFNTRQSGQF